MLKIGEFSKLSRISIRMLRHYDEIGLLAPKTVDHFSGYRYYSEDQLPTAQRIIALKEMGFALAVIPEILKSYHDPHALATFLTLKQSEARIQVKESKRRLLLLETAIEWLGKDENAMNYNVTLKLLPARYVASVRQVISAYEQEGTLWEILMRETAPLGLQDGDPCYTLAIFHDKEFKETDVEVEVQKSVRGSYEDTEHVRFKAEPPVEIASATYKGGYEKMSAVNHAVADWVRDNGYTFHGASFCIYHVSPHETQNPEEYVTEVCFPVCKK